MARPRQPRYAQIFKASPEQAETAARVWHEVIDHLDERGWLTARRTEIADRYARAYAEYETIYPKAAEEGPVKVGPNGGDVFNFNWSACEKLNDRLLKFEKALMLTPEAVGEDAPIARRSMKTAADKYLDA